MTSKKWDAVALLFEITTVLNLSPTLLTQKVPWPSIFLTSKISPLPSALLLLALLSSHLLYSYPSQPLSLLGSFPISTEIPSISMENTPPLFLLHLRGQLTPFSFQLALPPRIHMDSWWAARNPNQGPKWAHNIAQNRSGVYGPEPCRIWVPKLPKISVLHQLTRWTGWIGWTGCQPVKQVAKKIWKFDRMFLEEWGIHEKKMVRNSEFGKGRYDQNNYQKSVFYTG